MSRSRENSPVLGPDALVDLYVRLKPRLTSFFLRRTRDVEVALDLVAETFVRALEHARRFRGDGEADPWVWGIARNVLAEHLRFLQIEQRALRRLAFEPVEPMTVETPEAGEDGAAAEVAVIRLALARLVEDQRDALRLRVAQELDYAVVAGRLGISEATARARVSRGLRKLEAELSRAAYATRPRPLRANGVPAA